MRTEQDARRDPRPTDRDTAPQPPNPPSRYKGRCDMHGLRVCDECQYGETDAKLLDAAEKRIAALEAQLAEAQTCPTCYGTGEVLPAGPSDAPVEFCDACVVGLRKENEWWKERLAMAVEALFAYGDRNEMTADPWWAIVAKNRMGSNAILAGPFFSRERAEEHRQARLYEYGKGSIVFCFSGHRSQHYKDLRAALTATAPAVAEFVAGVERRGAEKARAGELEGK